MIPNVACVENCDGGLESVDAVEKADNEDEENCGNRCQSNNHYKSINSIFMFMYSTTSLNSVVSNIIRYVPLYLGSAGTGGQGKFKT